VESTAAFKAVKSGRREVETQRKSLRERVAAAAENAPTTTLPPIPGTTPPAATSGTPAVDQPAIRTKTPVDTAPTEGYANRLMKAKKRAKEQIDEQSEDAKS